jgi:hypothetical protein
MVTTASISLVLKTLITFFDHERLITNRHRTGVLRVNDVLVSWNFKHIVNLDRIRGYNGINFQNGHQMIEIRTPKEIFSYGNEE